MAPELLDSHLQIIAEKKDKFVGDKALSYSIKYIYNSIYNEGTREMIGSHIKTLLFDYTMPFFFMNDREHHDFE